MTKTQINAAVSGAAPIGTIVPFAGSITTEADHQWLREQGWLYCDGRSVAKREYAELFFAIGTNYGGNRENMNLPDFRGRFQRGAQNQSTVTPGDPDAASRGVSNPGGWAGDNVGSLQRYATAQPQLQPFVTNTTGEHTHDVPHVPVSNNAYATGGSHYGCWTNDSTTTRASGNHSHKVSGGGDNETRCMNKYVNFIIKFADAQ
jgi:microcystin-dependent protein